MIWAAFYKRVAILKIKNLRICEWIFKVLKEIFSVTWNIIIQSYRGFYYIIFIFYVPWLRVYLLKIAAHIKDFWSLLPRYMVFLTGGEQASYNNVGGFHTKTVFAFGKYDMCIECSRNLHPMGLASVNSYNLKWNESGIYFHKIIFNNFCLITWKERNVSISIFAAYFFFLSSI